MILLTDILSNWLIKQREDKFALGESIWRDKYIHRRDYCFLAVVSYVTGAYRDCYCRDILIMSMFLCLIKMKGVNNSWCGCLLENGVALSLSPLKAFMRAAW